MSEVRALGASSLSWSNIGDYMRLRDFHRLATACAATGATHYLHVMNWTLDMKGTFVMDYSTMPQSTGAQVKERIKMVDDALVSIKQQWRRQKLSTLFRYPPLDNLMNIADSLLAQKFHSRWLDVFAAATPQGVSAQCDVLQGPMYWEFAGADVVLHLQMTYT